MSHYAKISGDHYITSMITDITMYYGINGLEFFEQMKKNNYDLSNICIKIKYTPTNEHYIY